MGQPKRGHQLISELMAARGIITAGHSELVTLCGQVGGGWSRSIPRPRLLVGV